MFIYEPWKAPIADQKKAGVRIHSDGKEDMEGVYPKLMCDFGKRRSICLDGMKKAYEIGLYRDDPRVIDGRKLFDDDAEGPTGGSGFEDAMMDQRDDQKVKCCTEGGDNDGGAKEKGGESKGGDMNEQKGEVAKRKGVQGTLDGLVKRRTN